MSSNRTSNIIAFKPIKTLQETVGTQQEVFRQKRLENSSGHLSLRVGQEAYRLLNWSRTGLAFELEKDQPAFPVGLKVGPTKIFVGDIEVYNGDIEIRSVRKQDNGQFVIGGEFKSRLFLVEGIDAAVVVNQCLESINMNSEDIKAVSAEACKLIVELGSALRQLKKTCDAQEARLQNMTFDEKTEILAIFLPNISTRMKEILNRFSRRFAEVIDLETLPENTVYHRLFEEHLYPYFKSADLMRRAFEKPRGYAGDFEMMDAIYRNGFEGSDLMGKVLHHYAILEDQSDTVQFRKPYFLSHMEKALENADPARILSIASGPAIEIQEAVSRWPQSSLDRCNFILFDLDRGSLEHAQTKIFQLALDRSKSPNIDFFNASVKSFLTHHKDSPGSFDLIYSGGLFDYLDNLTSKAIVQSLYRLLAKRGTLVIGNMTKENSSKAFCHLLLKWHLIHKSEEEMREWVTGLPDAKVSFDYDPKKTQAFIVIRKG